MFEEIQVTTSIFKIMLPVIVAFILGVCIGLRN